MIQLELNDIGKKYSSEWIFKQLTYSFTLGSTTGIVGSNGSGKSTLIKIISASEIPSRGTLTYRLNEKEIEHSEVFSNLSYAAPYIDLAEELNLGELIDFHLSFKTFYKNLSKEQFLDYVYLKEAQNKFIKNFSSGMKQRLKLGLAICTRSELLLLDEPCSNLDTKGIAMYHRLMDEFNTNRTSIIGSNEQKDELYKTERILTISNYK